MPVNYSVNLAYDDIYSDYATIDPGSLAATVPTKMALALICHYTAQLHTLETSPQKQMEIINTWFARFPEMVVAKIQQKIIAFTQEGLSNFNFFNNVSSLYTIEFLLVSANNLPITVDLTPQQEENLFKLYIYFSAKWTKEQEAFMQAQKGRPVVEWALPLMLPFSELFEFKDFRLQFIKAIYFFKFCETDSEFKVFLDIFLRHLGLSSWHEYLINVVSVYTEVLDKDSVRSVVKFEPRDMNIYNALANFFADTTTFQAKKDFLELRQKPMYHYAADEILILNTNLFVDKIYQGILFDVAAALIAAKAVYRGKTLTSILDFIGIFGNDFVEQNLFYRIMEHTFKRKGYQHYSGDTLTAEFGAGTPDYVIIDKHKVYVFEFKNALFSAKAKYSYNPKEVRDEIYTKLVENTSGKPKGVTQLCNFVSDVANGRYAPLIGDGTGFTFYPIIITTDFSFNLPTINKFLNDEFMKQIHAKGFHKTLTIMQLTLIDLDSIIKFQDLFKTMRLSLHKELNEYPKYLQKGTNSIDQAVSFHRFLHDRTNKMKYNTPQIFFTEIANLIPAI